MSIEEVAMNQDRARVDAVFKALDSRPRRAILTMLAQAHLDGEDGCCGDGDLCACDFTDRLGLGAPTVSHHMKQLIEAGLVSSSKRGLWVYYRLVPDGFAGVLAELAPIVDAAAGCASEA